MKRPALYCAAVDDNGVLIVQRLAPDDLTVDDAAEYAADYSEVIYFEVAPTPTVEDVKQVLRDNIEKVVAEVASSMISLGASREWSMEQNFCTTEGIATLATTVGLPSAGNQKDDDLVFWRTIADSVGIYHDGEDD